MKILFLAHRLPYPPNKGDKIRSFHELRGLSVRHEVDLFCFYDDPADVNFLPLIQRYCRYVYAEPISLWRRRLRSVAALICRKPFTPAYFYSRSMMMQIREALRSRHYDLVFIFSSSMAQYARLHQSIPGILDMVDVDSDKWAQFAVHRPRPVSWIWRHEAVRLAKHESQLLDDFDTTLVCTRAEAELLQRKKATARIEVLENSLDTEYYDPAKVTVPPEIVALQPYLIFTGSMDYFPNVDAVVHFYKDVFTRISAAIPVVRLVIAGRKPVRSVRALARDSRVVVTGDVPDIRPYLLGAHAAVAPMRIARGVQNKILEAMAMGLHVVASSKAASVLSPSLVSHLLAVDDPGSMSESLCRLLRQPAASTRQIRDAVVEHFRNMAATELDEILESTLRFHRGYPAASDGSATKETTSAARLEGHAMFR